MVYWSFCNSFCSENQLIEAKLIHRNLLAKLVALLDRSIWIKKFRRRTALLNTAETGRVREEPYLLRFYFDPYPCTSFHQDAVVYSKCRDTSEEYCRQKGVYLQRCRTGEGPPNCSGGDIHSYFWKLLSTPVTTSLSRPVPALTTKLYAVSCHCYPRLCRTYTYFQRLPFNRRLLANSAWKWVHSGEPEATRFKPCYLVTLGNRGLGQSSKSQAKNRLWGCGERSRSCGRACAI